MSSTKIDEDLTVIIICFTSSTIRFEDERAHIQIATLDRIASRKACVQFKSLEFKNNCMIVRSENVESYNWLISLKLLDRYCNHSDNKTYYLRNNYQLLPLCYFKENVFLVLHLKNKYPINLDIINIQNKDINLEKVNEFTENNEKYYLLKTDKAKSYEAIKEQNFLLYYGLIKIQIACFDATKYTAQTLNQIPGYHLLNNNLSKSSDSPNQVDINTVD